MIMKMAKFDLTAKNCQYLDRHLTFPLLEFLVSKDVSKKIAKMPKRQFNLKNFYFPDL